MTYVVDAGAVAVPQLLQRLEDSVEHRRGVPQTRFASRLVGEEGPEVVVLQAPELSGGRVVGGGRERRESSVIRRSIDLATAVVLAASWEVTPSRALRLPSTGVSRAPLNEIEEGQENEEG